MRHRFRILLLAFSFVMLTSAFTFSFRDVPRNVAHGKGAAAPLLQTLTPNQQLALDIALADSRVLAHTLGQRSEVFGVATFLDVNTPISARGCGAENCRVVNIFNFDASATIQAFVRLDTEEVVEVYYQPGIRPGINRRLADRAMEIALKEPTVLEIVGEQRAGSDWAPMDSTLVGSVCEQGHICVAPTFDLGDYILWAIVDLTDEKFVDTFWSATEGEGAGHVAYPAGYENRRPAGCPSPGTVTRGGWVVNYNTTGTDGFRVSDVTYNGSVVIRSAKLVEWHVDYGGSGFQDVIGCGGGGGGFLIYPYGDTRLLDLSDGGGNVIGFEVVQDFRQDLWGKTCNYRYEQHYQFFDDGRFRTVEGAFGKGCGVTSTYRGLMRIDLALGGTDGSDSVAAWDGSGWQTTVSESRWCPEGETHESCVGSAPGSDADGHRFRLIDSVTESGFYIEPARGQFDDLGRGDFEFVYAVAHHPDEGDDDLGIFAVGCCNDYEHGPEQYVNGESIADSDIVLWYIPQMDTDANDPTYYCWTVQGEPNPETYPCFAGPMFVPFGGNAPSGSLYLPLIWKE